MSRNSKKRQHDRRDYIPAKEFREVGEWLDREILVELHGVGGEGIEAYDVPHKLLKNSPPVGWGKLTEQKQSSQFWSAVRRLSKCKLIEEYHSKAPRHNRSRVRIRTANVLDRLVHALGEEA